MTHGSRITQANRRKSVVTRKLLRAIAVTMASKKMATRNPTEATITSRPKSQTTGLTYSMELSPRSRRRCSLSLLVFR
jgi:hypothetical protein